MIFSFLFCSVLKLDYLKYWTISDNLHPAESSENLSKDLSKCKSRTFSGDGDSCVGFFVVLFCYDFCMR